VLPDARPLFPFQVAQLEEDEVELLEPNKVNFSSGSNFSIASIKSMYCILIIL
jgi:hypothetical protein